MAEDIASPESGDLLLEARAISKSFPGVKALDGVQIRLRRGRLNALLGENGAGKSTLMSILSGVFPPDSGEILLGGRGVRFASPREAQAAGISIIHQELNLIPHLSIAENIYLGREPLTPLGLVDFRRMCRDAGELLAALELDVDPRAPVARLRVGAQQIVEIAKALSHQSRVIIMDEPTSAITDQEIEVLFRLIRRLKSQGVGIIYTTHKLDELRQIADDVTILRDGRFIASDAYAAFTHDRMVQLMVGRELSELFPKTAPHAAEEVLRVENISLAHPDRPGDFAVSNISFSVRRGEVVGVFGLMGAGRTELLQTIFGLHPHSSRGTICVDGQPRAIRTPADAIAAGLALAPEDRKLEGLVLSMNVAENVSLASLCGGAIGMLQPQREREQAAQFVDRLGVKTPSVAECVRNLSGGNQQKVVLAKWLATQPKVLLLDEPTRGIDINAKREIYLLIDELARSGLGVVIVSSELPEILAVADRILVLAEGRLSAEFARDEASE
ncbi:MAG: sugar ABC transporter ATP-binding protein, partial [Pirellulales bacterium]